MTTQRLFRGELWLKNRKLLQFATGIFVATVTKAAGSLSIFFLPLKRRKRRQPRDKSTRLITHLAGDGDMKAYRKCQAFLSGERDVVVVAAQDNCTAEAKSEGNQSERGRLFRSHVICIIYLTVCRLLVARLAFLVWRVCLTQVERYLLSKEDTVSVFLSFF